MTDRRCFYFSFARSSNSSLFCSSESDALISQDVMLMLSAVSCLPMSSEEESVLHVVGKSEVSLQ